MSELVRNPLPSSERRKADTSSLAVRGLAAIQTGQVRTNTPQTLDTRLREYDGAVAIESFLTMSELVRNPLPSRKRRKAAGNSLQS